jgi:plastocyanin
MPRSRGAVAAMWLASAVLAAASCGDDGVGGGRAGSPATFVDISATDFRFEPAEIAVDEPGAVRFRVANDGKSVHALEVESPAGEVVTEEIRPEGAARLRAVLDKPGSYVMYCPVGNHRELGMEGEIVVARGDGGASGGDEDRPSSPYRY